MLGPMATDKTSSKTSGPRRGDADGEHGIADSVAGLIDELASNIPLGDTFARVVGTTERFTQAQAAAYSAVGLSSVQDIERITLRVRTMFHRIDELEDELDDAARRISALEREIADLRANAASAPAREKPSASTRKPAAAKSAAKKR